MKIQCPGCNTLFHYYSGWEAQGRYRIFVCTSCYSTFWGARTAYNPGSGFFSKDPNGIEDWHDCPHCNSHIRVDSGPMPSVCRHCTRSLPNNVSVEDKWRWWKKGDTESQGPYTARELVEIFRKTIQSKSGVYVTHVSWETGKEADWYHFYWLK